MPFVYQSSGIRLEQMLAFRKTGGAETHADSAPAEIIKTGINGLRRTRRFKSFTDGLLGLGVDRGAGLIILHDDGDRSRAGGDTGFCHRGVALRLHDIVL